MVHLFEWLGEGVDEPWPLLSDSSECGVLQLLTIGSGDWREERVVVRSRTLVHLYRALWREDWEHRFGCSYCALRRGRFGIDARVIAGGVLQEGRVTVAIVLSQE